MQFLYLIISLYLGRKNPLYYLIFPIALVSGPGAFIDPRTILIAEDVFIIGKNIFKDVIIMYLFFIVFLLRKRWSIDILFKSPIIYYGYYILLLIFITFLRTETNFEALNIMRLFTHMILGYFLVLLIFATANYKQFISFFNSLFFATGVFSIFYVLNSAKILPVFYQENLYSEIEMGSDSFFRDFNTIPYFSHILFILAFSLTLLESKIFNHKAILFSLTTYPFVLLYTFTRSILTYTLIECSLIMLILVIKKPERVLKTSTFFIVLSFLVIYWVVQTKFRNELNYFTERIANAKDEGVDEENVQVRLAYHLKAYEILKYKNSFFLGTGLNKKYDSEMNNVGAWTADSTIPFFLIYTGILGVIFYFFIGYYFVLRTGSQLIKQFNPFSLALFALIITWMFSSFIMGGYNWGDPLIYFPFVLVTTIDSLLKKDLLSIIN